MAFVTSVKNIVRKVLYSRMKGNYTAYRLYTAIRVRTIGNAGRYLRKPLGKRQPPLMIFVCDPQVGVNGGLTDRLRGMVSMYGLCAQAGWRFGIWFDTPFMLEDYLVPAEYDWRVTQQELDFEHAVPVFCQDYVGGKAPEYGLRMLQRAMKRHSLIHVYTNICPSWEEFSGGFGRLFRPSAALETLLEQNRKALGVDYCAAVFRFQQLLGDFDETGLTACPPTISPEARGQLISSCLERLEKMHERTGGRILVTSDSVTFLAHAAAALEYVYIIPGRVVHLDYTKGEADEVYMKSFVDFHMLAGARRVTLITGPGMYRSGFARAAASVGGTEYVEEDFE